ncbi:MAG: CHASE sensor domain-containing protein [Myxococcaceae bacterium]
MRLSIESRLSLSIAGLVVAAIAVVGFVITVSATHQLEDEQVMKIDRYGELAAAELGPALDFDDRELANDELRALAKDPELVSITLYDEAGTVLAQVGEPVKAPRG